MRYGLIAVFDKSYYVNMEMNQLNQYSINQETLKRIKGGSKNE